MINAHLNIPAIMTKTPPPKTKINEIFLFISRFALHSMGIGIDIRYMSVSTFKITVTYRSIFEMAGWQKSARMCQRLYFKLR